MFLKNFLKSKMWNYENKGLDLFVKTGEICVFSIGD